jgi:hypothetical protein
MTRTCLSPPKGARVKNLKSKKRKDKEQTKHNLNLSSYHLQWMKYPFHSSMDEISISFFNG